MADSKADIRNDNTQSPLTEGAGETTQTEETAAGTAPGPKPRRGFWRTLARALMWTVIGLIGLVVLLCVLVYVPPVQDFAVKTALGIINKGGTMHIDVKKLRLRFPLNVTVDSLDLSTPGMRVSTAYADASVLPMPLLRGEIAATELGARGAHITIGTPDSAMYMNVALDAARITKASVILRSQEINVDALKGSGAKVKMWMRPDSVPRPEAPDSVPVNWHIRLRRADLSDIDYFMQLEPMINDLSCSVDAAHISDAEVDMRVNKVRIGEIGIDSVNARYIYYPPEYVAAYPIKAWEAPDTVPYTPWTVTASKLRLTNGEALYALKGHTPPSAAFDPEYAQATGIEVAVDSFLNRATTVVAPVRRIAARERCGVPLEASGLFAMDSVLMRISNFLITTPSSRISASGSMGMAAPGDSMNIMQTPVSLQLNASLSNEDLRRLVPYPMTAMMAQLPPYAPVEAAVDLRGTAAKKIEVNRLMARIPGHIELSAKGYAENALGGIDRMRAQLNITGNMRNGRFLKPMLLDAKMGKEIDFPPLTVKGAVTADRGVIDGDLRCATGNGDVALAAAWNNRRQGYSLDLEASAFPLQNIMPGLGVKDLDAMVKISGEGFDPFSASTHMQASVDLHRVVYQNQELRDATMTATVADGHASFNANSRNRNANFTLEADGNLTGDTLNWTFDGNIRHLDLMALNLSPTVSEGNVKLSGKAAVAADGRYSLLEPLLAMDNPAPKNKKGRRAPRKAKKQSPDGIAYRISGITADLNVADFYWRMPGMTINGNDVLLSFLADSADTRLHLVNHDLDAKFLADAPLGRLGVDFTNAGNILDYCMKTRIARVDSIQHALPPFTFDMEAGRDNLLHNYLMDLNMTYERLNFHVANDSLLSANGFVNELKFGETRLDSVDMRIGQQGKYLFYSIKVDNRPGTFDAFAKVNARGFLGPENFSLIFRQENIDGETGFSFGSVVNMPDSSTVALRFVPYHPVIGYKNWEINRDNIISYNFATHHIDANLNLHNDLSTVELLTQHNPADSAQEALTVRLKDIEIADWLAINPFAPPMRGRLSADMNIAAEEKALKGNGTVSLADFFYNRQKVGNFDIDFDVHTAQGMLRADAEMKVNGAQAMTLSGVLSDSTAVNPFNLDMKVIHFPLAVANPFLPDGTATMSGTLNGSMEVTGKMASPVLNGWVAFDSAAVVPTMLGTRLDLSSEKIPVNDNLLTLDNFTIKAVNDNPLTINGWVDIHNLALINMDLSLAAKNMQIVGGKRVKSADIYGRAFVDLDAHVKGSTEYMRINADAKLLSGTNVTYVIPGLTQDIAHQTNAEMVKFVNFTDTAAIDAADSIVRPSMLMDIDAQLTVQQGTTVAVDLSADGKNRVQLQSWGTVNYSSDYLDDQHVTGRLNINQGFVRYTPPLMSEKLFNFEEGSYVAFNGDMMDPVLNIKAVDHVKANVTEANSDTRQVTFDVSLSVTGSLANMNVAFDLSTNDDITVENELKSMSPDQRANSAMNLLVTNTYTGPGTKASVGGNPLFSLLTSQLNSLAARTIKGVDLSFGINQLDRAGSSSAMNYSYRVSKSLFDDRFKIVVGGNYTTDANADENFAQNLIADISFEYLLNKQGTMYVRLFRHTGYESILEGEITQTGVGFVYKKRIQRLGDIFRFMSRKRRKTVPVATPVSPAVKLKETEKETLGK